MYYRPLLLVLFLLGLAGCGSQKEKQAEGKATQKPQQPNILFIAIDDLRPQLGCYGNKQVKSPHLDAFAQSASLFETAYCNAPVCGASRASLLTGLHPTPDRFTDYHTYIKKDAPEATTLAGHLKSNGYHTESLGKITHHTDDIPGAWSVPARDPQTNGNWRDYLRRKNRVLEGLIPEEQLTEADRQVLSQYQSTTQRGMPYEKYDTTDQAYWDGKLAQMGIERLQALKNQEKPFFLALGFIKPHLPFTAPSQYWERYDPQQLSFPANYYRDSSIPSGFFHDFAELRQYGGIPPAEEQKLLDTAMARKLIHGYHAAVSYVDAQVGKVLQALDNQGLAENTLVVLWGDHGWFLGEHALWCKHTNFRQGLRTVLMMRKPGQEKGRRVSQAVEFVDIFPTICELTGLSRPEQLQGRSLAPLLNGENPKGQKAFYSRLYGRESVKEGRYLYTELRNGEGETYGRVLFDHQKDPQENQNLAQNPEYEAVVERLHDSLAHHRKTVYGEE